MHICVFPYITCRNRSWGSSASIVTRLWGSIPGRGKDSLPPHPDWL